MTKDEMISELAIDRAELHRKFRMLKQWACDLTKENIELRRECEAFSKEVRRLRAANKAVIAAATTANIRRKLQRLADSMMGASPDNPRPEWTQSQTRAREARTPAATAAHSTEARDVGGEDGSK